MVKYFKNNRGSFYTIIAILCLVNLFLGFELIRKVTYKNIIPAFNTNLKKEKKTIEIGKSSDLFLEILTSSNSYMKTVLNETNKDMQVKNKFVNMFKNNLSFLNPRIYLKSQLPAVFALVEDEDVRTVTNILDDKDTSLLEDKTGGHEGIEVESTKDLISSEKPKSIKLNDEDPYIMIYHTHATESYAPIKQNNYHVEKREHNVITIGEKIGQVLNEKGHKVKHIEKYHDLPSFNKSYNESLKTVKEELSNNENLKIILDVHRDGIDENSKYIGKAQSDARVNINGKSVATFKMVVGPDNPNKEQLLKFSRYIRDKANEKYPGLCKGIIVKPYGKFNQYVSDYYTLLEIGSNLTTMDEAKETGLLVGEILDEVILDLKEDK